jgi:hypothetical protein
VDTVPVPEPAARLLRDTAGHVQGADEVDVEAVRIGVRVLPGTRCQWPARSPATAMSTCERRTAGDARAAARQAHRRRDPARRGQPAAGHVPAGTLALGCSLSCPLWGRVPACSAILDGWQQPGQHRHGRAVGPAGRGPGDLAPQRRHLVPEHHDLGVDGRLSVAPAIAASRRPGQRSSRAGKEPRTAILMEPDHSAKSQVIATASSSKEVHGCYRRRPIGNRR